MQTRKSPTGKGTSYDKLASGASVTVEQTVVAPAAGDHQFNAKADANNDIANESDEANNMPVGADPFGSLTVSMWRPDLALQSVWTEPASPLEGQPYRIKATIKNIGDTRIDLGLLNDVDLLFYVDGQQVDAKTLDGLKPKASVTLASKSLTGPVAGSHEAKVAIDVNAEVTEKSEANNAVAITATVNSLDLSSWDCYVTDAASWGQVISVQSQVQRTGTLPSSAFKIQWYLSMDPVGSADDILLKLANGSSSYTHPAIGASDTLAPDMDPVNLRLPSALPRAWYGTSFYLLQKVDAGGMVTESIETNNFDRDVITIVTDDYPNAADWANAPRVAISTDSNKIVSWLPFVDGSQGGRIDTATDTDVFKFRSWLNGSANITVSPAWFSSVDCVVTILDHDGKPLGSPVNPPNSKSAATSIAVDSADVYYIVVDGAGSVKGNYSVKIDLSPGDATAFDAMQDRLDISSNINDLTKYYVHADANYDVLTDLGETALREGWDSAAANRIQTLASKFKGDAKSLDKFGDLLQGFQYGTMIVEFGAKVASGQDIEALTWGLGSTIRAVCDYYLAPVIAAEGAKLGAIIGSAFSPGIGTAIGFAGGAIVGGMIATEYPGNLYDVLIQDFVLDVGVTLWGIGG